MIFISEEVGGQFADDNFEYDNEGNLLNLKSDLHTWADKNGLMWERHLPSELIEDYITEGKA